MGAPGKLYHTVQNQTRKVKGKTHAMSQNTDYDGSLFVIVNTSRGVDVFPAPGMHYVLPGEEPKTFGTLDEAAESLLDLTDEYGHTVETAPIFRLVPVPVDEVDAAVERARVRLDEDLD